MPPGRRSEDWVNSISRTLQWNSRQRQKAYADWDGDKGDHEDAKGKDSKPDDDRQDMKRGGQGHPGWHKG